MGDIEIEDFDKNKLKVFLIVFSGGTYDILKRIINNLCLSFNARLYDFN